MGVNMNEPVAWIQADGTMEFAPNQVFAVGQPFYTHPSKDLTDEEINELYADYQNPDYYSREVIFDQLGFARAILRKAQEK